MPVNLWSILNAIAVQYRQYIQYKLMLRFVSLSIFLMGLWLLMSGLFKPLLVGFGVVSCLVSVWLMTRMEKIDGEKLSIRLKPISAVSYLLWLLKEIAVSTYSVTKIVISSKSKFKQKLFSVPTTQHSDIGQVIYANSITLTPGTITVETEPGYFLIHALDHHPSNYEALADMDARVTYLEQSHGEDK